MLTTPQKSSFYYKSHPLHAFYTTPVSLPTLLCACCLSYRGHKVALLNSNATDVIPSKGTGPGPETYWLPMHQAMNHKTTDTYPYIVVHLQVVLVSKTVAPLTSSVVTAITNALCTYISGRMDGILAPLATSPQEFPPSFWTKYYDCIGVASSMYIYGFL